MKKALFLLLLLVNITVFAQTDSLPGFVRDSLDMYVQRAMQEWQIPGVAVAIVRDGKVVLMKGYGIREEGNNEKVDENTLFMIGSNTKAFTATALAMLDSRKKLSLDDKVQKWLPDFTLYDPWVAKEAIIRDLLCHRLGFETFQGDFMYFDSDLSTAEVREKMGKLKPLYSFRSKWGYTNSAFMTAGEIIPKVTGKSWATFITDSIFQPLGMSRSLALSVDIDHASNRAAAHTIVEGKLRKIPYGHIDNLAPAGSISSSVSDLTHWVIAQLGGGKYEGRQVIPVAAINETRTPHSILGNGNVLFNKGHFALYGLGWFLQEYSGRKIVSHTGGVNGFVTSITLVPEDKLGIVVLTNTDANNFYEALKWEVMDAYFSLPYRNYDRVYYNYYSAAQKQDAEWLRKKRDTIAMARNNLPLASYTGEYRHDVYGTMTISNENGKLIARFQHHKGRYATLEYLGPGRLLASFNDPLYGNKEWIVDVADNKVKSIKVQVADFVEFTPYTFTKTK
jgi:CubicO group peptidase (beta-lactamase class C family)